MLRPPLLFVFVFAASCNGWEGSGRSHDAGAPLDAPAVACTLGSVYGGRPPINPDDPQYEDANWTQEQVTEAFAMAKAKNSIAYRAYKAAYAHPDIITCAFCPCGCSKGAGHKSGVDCYKDMHGFNCGTCQDFAMRMDTLLQAGMPTEQVKRTLQSEYPAH